MANIFNNQFKMKTILSCYWGVVAVAYLLYLYLMSIKSASGIMPLLQSDGSAAIILLMACTYIVQFFIMWSVRERDFSKTNSYGVYLLLTCAQQLLLRNIIGSVLCVIIYVMLPKKLNKTTSSQKTALIISNALIFLLTIVILVVRMRLT